MAELAFDCIDVRADTYAAGPTLVFRLRISETTGDRVHAVALRCQLRIEPNKRRYGPEDARRLNDVFGDPSRWAETQHAMQLATVAVMVPSFTGATEIDVPVPCTYDMDVATTRYFHALRDGEVPVLMLFSGTLITRGSMGFEVTQVPWHKETTARIPVAEWRSMMDTFFPDCGWIRLQRDTLDALADYKNRHAFATFEQTLLALLAEVRLPADGVP